MVIDVKVGDVVFVLVFMFVVMVEVVLIMGVIFFFVDIDWDMFNLELESLKCLVSVVKK